MNESYTYKHPRVALSVDCVIIGYSSESKYLLLIQRKNPPFQDQWALPGGFHDPGETVKQAAKRELEEETTLNQIELEEIGVFSDPSRDPREQVISVALLGETTMTEVCPQAQDDAKDVRWFPLDQLPPLAFDHPKIITKALNYLTKENHA